MDFTENTTRQGKRLGEDVTFHSTAKKAKESIFSINTFKPNLKLLKEAYGLLFSREKHDFEVQFGCIGDLLLVVPDWNLFRAMLKFYVPQYQAFVFPHFELVPTIDEYHHFLRCSPVVDSYTFTPQAQHLKFTLAKVQEMLQAMWGFPFEFSQPLGMTSSQRINFLALGVYGMVIFLIYIKTIAPMVVALFEQLLHTLAFNLASTMVAETLWSMKEIRAKRFGRFSGCIELFIAWAHGHLRGPQYEALFNVVGLKDKIASLERDLAASKEICGKQKRSLEFAEEQRKKLLQVKADLKAKEKENKELVEKDNEHLRKANEQLGEQLQDMTINHDLYKITMEYMCYQLQVEKQKYQALVEEDTGLHEVVIDLTALHSLYLLRSREIKMFEENVATNLEKSAVDERVDKLEATMQTMVATLQTISLTLSTLTTGSVPSPASLIPTIVVPPVPTITPVNRAKDLMVTQLTSANYSTQSLGCDVEVYFRGWDVKRGCSYAYLQMYARKMAPYANDERVLIHYFQDSLSSPTSVWFSTLDKKKIRTFKDVSQAFMKQYEYNMSLAPIRDSLQRITKKGNETFKEFAQRWRSEAAKVIPPLTDSEICSLYQVNYQDLSCMVSSLCGIYFCSVSDSEGTNCRWTEDGYHYGLLNHSEAIRASQDGKLKIYFEKGHTLQNCGDIQRKIMKLQRMGSLKFMSAPKLEKFIAPVTEEYFTKERPYILQDTKRAPAISQNFQQPYVLKTSLSESLIGKTSSVVMPQRSTILNSTANDASNMTRSELMLSSEVHLDTLLKVLKEANVPKNIDTQKFGTMVGAILAPNYINFTDDEIPDEGNGHTKALHILVQCKMMNVPYVLIDNGSALTVIPITVLKQLKIELLVEIGPVTFDVDFFVMDISLAFNMLLGRPWIHVAGAVPSTLHQKVKCIVNGVLVIVSGEEEHVIQKAITIPYIGIDLGTYEYSYHSMECAASYIHPKFRGKLAEMVKLARVAAKIMLACLYQLGKGLGLNGQGILEPIEVIQAWGTFGLGYKPKKEDWKRMHAIKAEKRLARLQRRNPRDEPMWVTHIRVTFPQTLEILCPSPDGYMVKHMDVLYVDPKGTIFTDRLLEICECSKQAKFEEVVVEDITDEVCFDDEEDIFGFNNLFGLAKMTDPKERWRKMLAEKAFMEKHPQLPSCSSCESSNGIT
ncbi:hypothetical protein SLEP1_g42472 [Rubroshorea leprosula]|uniref:G-patch domain-containing protein n=1 Tax=Rubroshorea leprosula TaxID=152421 RepID=A0AAV5LAC0_9ROSI|nr:hypothetical protein SLEP1_g42472 [Rubroshorea leprosula]